MLTFFVFSMVIGTKVTARRWPWIKNAFNNFDINKIADYNDKDIERFLNSPFVIKNLKKTKATILNAKELLEIRKEYGSFHRYMNHFTTEEDLINDLSQRIHYIGKPSIKRFVNITREK